MACFQRLIVLFLLSISFNAHATYDAEVVYYINTQPPLYSGAVAACDGYISVKNLTVVNGRQWQKSVGESGTSVCKAYLRDSSNSVWDSFNFTITKAGKCGTVVTPNNFFCAGDPPPVCTAGQVISSGVYANGSSPLTPFPNIVCAGGCVATFSGVWPDSRSCANDTCTYYAKGNFAKNGSTCSGGTSAPPPLLSVPMSPEQAALKALQDAQQAAFDAALAAKRAEDKAFNDALAANAGSKASAAAAAKSASDKAAADSALKAAEAKAAAAKAASDAAAADAINNDPNATQAQKDAATGLSGISGAASSAAAGAAATAASTAASAAAAAATAAGNAAEAAKATEQKTPEQLCAAYPNAPACLVHTADAGFCVAGKLAGFKCGGDAISCEATRVQQEAFCANLQTDGLNDFGTSLINQEKTFTSDVGSFDNPTQIQVGQINSSSFLPKACLADLNFQIVGQNIPLPLSKLCTGLEIAGRIVKYFAYMIAIKIIFS